jgi:hypothetical protein
LDLGAEDYYILTGVKWDNGDSYGVSGHDDDSTRFKLLQGREIICVTEFVSSIGVRRITGIIDKQASTKTYSIIEYSGDDIVPSSISDYRATKDQNGNWVEEKISDLINITTVDGGINYCEYRTFQNGQKMSSFVVNVQSSVYRNKLLGDQAFTVLPEFNDLCNKITKFSGKMVEKVTYVEHGTQKETVIEFDHDLEGGYPKKTTMNHPQEILEWIFEYSK